MNEGHLLCHETGLALLLCLERDLAVPFLPPGFDDRADADYSRPSLVWRLCYYSLILEA